MVDILVCGEGGEEEGCQEKESNILICCTSDTDIVKSPFVCTKLGIRPILLQ